ncbi:GGDEF domain-containing protein [Deinococcus seoulensis]|nr:GGDEF domain-containing protein [Deinococcus seoulensis]
MRRFRISRYPFKPRTPASRFEETHDISTGLLNRRSWARQFGIQHDGNETQLISLMNIDHLKRFDDVYGLPMGDQAVRLVASIASLHACMLGPYSQIYRVGGDEIVIVWPPLPVADVRHRAEAIRTAIESVGPGITMTVVTAQALSSDEPDILLARLRSLMAVTKSGGRNRSVLELGIQG